MRERRICCARSVIGPASETQLRRFGLVGNAFTFEDHDVLLTATAGAPPVEVGRWEGGGALRTLVGMGRVYPFTGVWNYTGQPAAAVPAGFTADGLPLSVQLVGRPGDEETLLSLAAQIEAERPWAARTPPVE